MAYRIVGMALLVAAATSCLGSAGDGGRRPPAEDADTQPAEEPPAVANAAQGAEALNVTKTYAPDEYLRLTPFPAKVVYKKTLHLSPAELHHSAAGSGVLLHLLLDDGTVVGVRYPFIDANWLWASPLRRVEIGKRYMFTPREGPSPLGAAAPPVEVQGIRRAQQAPMGEWWERSI